ncbi:phosphoribosylformylglycinamidine synthase [Vibrio toranzoniae]|uniref:Phosphoribosylformylglycinamidine synthase n=1 Tax=Vibrio toranzoniae TaxID=1194427 RepID=A0A120DG79_9VIBR|nr:phosphoribosylformylglycinamidine synthase [Vibrio toranzoniae]
MQQKYHLYRKIKKITQTVAFGVTSQKEMLYNALALKRWNRHRFGNLREILSGIASKKTVRLYL